MQELVGVYKKRSATGLNFRDMILRGASQNFSELLRPGLIDPALLRMYVHTYIRSPQLPPSLQLSQLDLSQLDLSQLDLSQLDLSQLDLLDLSQLDNRLRLLRTGCPLSLPG